MARPEVRDDVAMIPGYHSPQVEATVRLNTNEAPEPPPVEFRERVAAAMADLAWHRYPRKQTGNEADVDPKCQMLHQEPYKLF